MSKKLSNNTLSAFATALLCTVWMVIANATGLLGWAGFAGCTAYFAGPKKGVSALPLTFACVGSGVAYALISVHLGNQIDFAQYRPCIYICNYIPYVCRWKNRYNLIRSRGVHGFILYICCWWGLYDNTFYCSGYNIRTLL